MVHHLGHREGEERACRQVPHDRRGQRGTHRGAKEEGGHEVPHSEVPRVQGRIRPFHPREGRRRGPLRGGPHCHRRGLHGPREAPPQERQRAGAAEARGGVAHEDPRPGSEGRDARAERVVRASCGVREPLQRRDGVRDSSGPRIIPHSQDCPRKEDRPGDPPHAPPVSLADRARVPAAQCPTGRRRREDGVEAPTRSRLWSATDRLLRAHLLQAAAEGPPARRGREHDREDVPRHLPRLPPHLERLQSRQRRGQRHQGEEYPAQTDRRSLERDGHQGDHGHAMESKGHAVDRARRVGPSGREVQAHRGRRRAATAQAQDNHEAA